MITDKMIPTATHYKTLTRPLSMILLLSLLLLNNNVWATPSQIQEGDLVFFTKKMVNHSFGDAIAKSDKNNTQIIHVAIISKMTPEIKIIHAIDENGVNEQSLDFFKSKAGFTTKFCRVKVTREITQRALKLSRNYLDLPYNDLFTSNGINSNGNKSLYCSQLIQKVYNEASSQELFELEPLNFKDSSGNIIDYWKTYYKNLNHPIPLDDVGSHPARLYSNKNIQCFN